MCAKATAGIDTSPPKNSICFHLRLPTSENAGSTTALEQFWLSVFCSLPRCLLFDCRSLLFLRTSSASGQQTSSSSSTSSSASSDQRRAKNSSLLNTCRYIHTCISHTCTHLTFVHIIQNVSLSQLNLQDLLQPLPSSCPQSASTITAATLNTSSLDPPYTCL